MELKNLFIVLLSTLIIYLVFATFLNPKNRDIYNYQSKYSPQELAQISFANASDINKEKDPEQEIKHFFNLLDNEKTYEAIYMLDGNNRSTYKLFSIWKEHFNSIEMISVIDVTPYKNQLWTKSKQEYEVTLLIKLKDSSKSSYGWTDNKVNKRIITLTKEGTNWKIEKLVKTQ
jgi:hypothetical protein